MSSKEEKKRISIREIDHVLENAPGIFKLADIAAKLGAPGDDELLKRLEQLIDGDANYFHTDDWECELKMHYFCRIPFAVTPEKWEIEEGVLFPGSRLTPFLTEDVFPSDAELLYDDEPLPKKEITLPFCEALFWRALPSMIRKSPPIWSFYSPITAGRICLAHFSPKGDMSQNGL